MNLEDAKKRIQAYLKSEKAWPLIVDVQTKKDRSELMDFFKVGENKFISAEQFCKEDSSLKLDELYDALSKNSGTTFVVCLSGFLKLLGETRAKAELKTLGTSTILGHVVVITYQCQNYLKSSDPRIAESGRVLVVEGFPDVVANICFIAPSLADAFSNCYHGLHKIGEIVEECTNNEAYIITAAQKNFYSESAFNINQISSGYDILQSRDPKTSLVPRGAGSDEQWSYALSKMGRNGNWNSLIEDEFGSVYNLSKAISSYSTFYEMKKWLYYIALHVFGAKNNEYLQKAVNKASSSDDLIKTIFHSILDFNRTDAEFADLYEQRKGILNGFKDNLAEITDYCKALATKEEDAIYYLTDLTNVEKERIITWLDLYGKNYNISELIDIFKVVYPDFAYYLEEYNYKNDFLNSYFETYKYQKVINHILPSFEETVNKQAVENDFIRELEPRSDVVDKINVANSHAFFVDALGVEYLGFIQQKCNGYGLSTNISCARCELPSITSFNKEFVETFKSKGCSVSDIKDLDEIKHHGKNNFDYENEKKPIYLIYEPEIIDELLKKIRASIFNGEYDKAIIVSDHGASRLAVLHDTENIWSMETSGEHSGRCCPINEINSKPDFAIEENGFWVLANYDRFKGSRRANVEVHGGASLEEVAVSIIEIIRKRADIKAYIVGENKEIKLGVNENAVINIYVSIVSNNICIKINGEYYEANLTEEKYIYSVELPKSFKKGKYSFDILNKTDILASNQQIEIKSKGMTTKSDMFDF